MLQIFESLYLNNKLSSAGTNYGLLKNTVNKFSVPQLFENYLVWNVFFFLYEAL